MTTSLVALCADAESLRHPETVGLAGENLAVQPWLRLFSTAEEARAFLRSDHLVDEVWVASCDDVAPINLAATLKRDRPDRRVCMLSFEETGSLKSRVSATGIDASLTRQAFAERYAQRKRSASLGSAAAQPTAAGGLTGDSAVVLRPQPQQPMQPQVQAHPFAQPQVQVAVQRGRTAFLMPVVSGSGGAGKSTVAALAGLIGQRLGLKTLVLDFDLQFGDMPVLLGVQRPLVVDELLAAPARLEQVRPEGSLPALLAAPRKLEDAEAVVDQAPMLLDQLAQRFDLIVANTGAAWAEQHAVLLERSSKALFLVDQRPSSLRACQHALDLCARCGIATGPFLFAVNRCAKNALFTSIDVSCALGGAHVAELKDGGFEVEELLNAGEALELAASRNELCASLEELLLDVLPEAAVRASRENDAATRSPGLGLLRGKRTRRKRKGSPCL